MSGCWLLTNLDGKAITVGLIWLALGIVYLVWITRGFRRPPPKVNFEEAEQSADRGIPDNQASLPPEIRTQVRRVHLHGAAGFEIAAVGG